jgi:hypothetical protein
MVAATTVAVILVRPMAALRFFITMFYGCNDKVESKMRYWWCRIAAVGFCQIFGVGSYVCRDSVPYRLLTEKIFPCSGTKDLFLQCCQFFFLLDVEKDIFLVVMRVSLTSKITNNKHNIFHDKGTILNNKGGCRRKEKNR